MNNNSAEASGASRRHIAIITSTRADWGLLSPIARSLSARSDCQVSIIATNMHLDPRLGNTVEEIEADGLQIAARVAMPIAGEGAAADVARADAACMAGMADAFERLRPDMVVVLGDRSEILAAALAATIMRLPIAHIAGGETTSGAIDDAIRHAITQLSSLHLTSTEPYRQKVISMGADPATVINTGAIGVYSSQEPLMSRQELEASLGFAIAPGTLLLTYHPATLDTEATPGQRFEQLLAALDLVGRPLLITYPNNDANGQQIIDRIKAYQQAHPERVNVVPSLGHRRYLSALKYVDAVVGNSSSGIVEVPSAGIPTIDIGPRQQGRIAAPSVIHCLSHDPEKIAAAIRRGLSEEMRDIAAQAVNPYYKPNTLQLIVDAIATFPLQKSQPKADTLYIIPARGGSKGIPHKNIKPLAGKPLICYTIEVALKLAPLSHIILSTDDPEIARVGREAGLIVDYMRPAELATDTSGTREVIIDAMDWAESRGVVFDKVCLLQPTSPLRTVEDVERCLELYTPDVDMVVSVVEATSNPYYNCFETSPSTGFLHISKGDGMLTRRQDAPPAWEYNGAVYVINPEAIRRSPFGAMQRRRPCVVSRDHSIDLDTPLDWAVAETIINTMS